MITTLIIFAIICVIFAKIDANQFAKGKTISHFVNALEVIPMLILAYFLFKNYWLIGAMLVERLLFFNIALSRFRGKKWNYVTPEPKPASIIDRMAKAVFGMRGTLMYAVYLTVFIVLLILTFEIHTLIKL